MIDFLLGSKLHGMTYLFEDDMLSQEGPVVLPHRQLWVVLQGSNHIHHVLFCQQHLQQFCTCTRASAPKDAKGSLKPGHKLLRNGHFVILLETTWQKPGDLFCSSAMNSGAGKAAGWSGHRACFTTACESTGKATFA